MRISGPIPDVKKYLIDQWLGKNFILRKISGNQDISEQVWFFPITVGGLGEVVNLENFEFFLLI